MSLSLSALNSSPLKLTAGIGIVLVGGLTDAALISSTVDTFSNNTTGGAPPAGWTPFNPGNQTLTLESSFSDRNALDASEDGYLNIVRDSAANQTVGAVRSLGDVADSDVGSTIVIDVAYEKTAAGGSTTNYELILDGVAVSSAQINIFSSGNDPGAAAGRLSTVIGSPLTYVVNAGDVGKVAAFQARYFASNPNRELGLDAVNISIAPVPEPTAVVLLVLGGPFTRLWLRKS